MKFLSIIAILRCNTKLFIIIDFLLARQEKGENEKSQALRWQRNTG